MAVLNMDLPSGYNYDDNNGMPRAAELYEETWDPYLRTSMQSSQYTGVEDERPLMEELGINLDQIMQKTWAVLSFKNLDDHKNILHETDLAGPLVFLLAFGTLLLFTGKIQFGYVFGLGTVGCLIIYSVVYLMAPKVISFFCTVSVLGYCLLPMVLLSALSIVIDLKISIVGNLVSVLAILWCAFGASNLFTTAIEMSNSRILIAYPCMLFYTVFALLTVF